MRKVAIVVLNYHTWADTVRLVQSASVLTYPEVHVYIVDNGSPAAIYEKLAERLSDVSGVSLIRLAENVGFARGMNVGIRRARADGVDSVLVCNSDIEFRDSNTLELMTEALSERVAVVAPNIETRDGVLQNPYRMHPITGWARLFAYWQYGTRSGQVLLGFRRWMTRMLRGFPSVYKEVRRARTVRRRSREQMHECVSSEPTFIYMPHGSCFLLGRTFFDRVGLLDEGTFLYGEEWVLAEQCYQNKLLVRFLPSVTVLHREDASSRAAWGEDESTKKAEFMKRSMHYWAVKYLRPTLSDSAFKGSGSANDFGPGVSR